MKLLKELYLISEAEKDEKVVPPAEADELENQEPTQAEDDAENKDEGTDNLDDEDAVEGEPEKESEPQDVGSVSQTQGFKKSSSEMYAFGKTRKVTLLTKNDNLGGIKLTLQYVINPETGAWSFKACLAGQTEADMVEFDSGEDPSSLVKSLQKKRKITPHQAVEFLNPPADQEIESETDEGDDETVS